MKKSLVSRIYTWIIYILLYAPIAVMILFSFNESKSMTVFTGFSLRWYGELFSSGKAFEALKYSMIIAVLSAIISTIIGTLAAYGVHYMSSRWLRRLVSSVNNIPMMNPDIVTGISMLLLFAFIQLILGLNSSILGFGTLLIAHITFNVPYVILSVLPKLRQMDKSLTEAGLDLGCTPAQAFFKIELPSIMPGILSGAIMAFTLSLDDFVISNFTIGNSFQTLPILIYSMTKREVTPDMNAICSIVFVVIFLLLLLSTFTGDSKKTDDSGKKTFSEKFRAVRSEHPKGFNITALILACVIVLGTASLFIFVNPEKEETLNVYNWGEYISDGSDDSLDVIAAFEEWYEEEYGKKIKVNYTTYASNEDLYNKLSSGAADYDVIIPSDYMIAKLASEDMLEKLDFDLIPNYSQIDDGFKGLYYDPDEQYSVPYSYGVIGLIYNTQHVDEEDVTSWELMNNAKYKGKILQYNNQRDAFGTAMYNLGISVNTTDHAEWDRALEWLAAQKPLIQSYVMDEIYNKMESGEAYISSYYAGDFLFMYQNNEDLEFFQPEAVNYFIDAMAIPKGAKNYETANIFINWMLTEEPAVANAEMICYACPNNVVRENEEYIEYLNDIKENAYDILYPEGLDFKEEYDKYAYCLLDAETNNYMNSLWSKLKIASSEEEDAGPDVTNLVAVILLVIIVAGLATRALIKKKRSKFY